MDKPPATERFVGIDVSKPASTSMCVPAPPRLPAPPIQEVRPSWSPYERLQPRRDRHGGQRWLRGLVAATWPNAGLPVAIVNPRQVRKFAGAIGRLAKTDAIDAGVIAHFADAIRPTPKPMPDDLMLRLRELLARRRQLVIMITAEKPSR